MTSEDIIETLVEALEPFADAIITDADDVELDTAHLRFEHYWAAYQALKPWRKPV